MQLLCCISGYFSNLCSCQVPPQEEGDLKEETTEANAQTDSSRKGSLCGFSFLPQPGRCKFEPPRARKYVSQCWWSPQCFWNPIVTHGLEQLDTTTGEAFWKAISLAHNIGLTAWEVNGKTHSDFNERRSRSVLENLMHSLYILSLIPCDPQRKRNNSESPPAKQGSFTAWAGVLLPL